MVRTVCWMLSKSDQRLQNRAVHIILQQDSSRNMFCRLNWVDLATRRGLHKFYLVPVYLNDYYFCEEP